MGSVPGSSSPPNVGELGDSSLPPISSPLFPLTAPGISGTVGIFTGTTGVRMGMGPVPVTEPERRPGFDEGVRRIVATPGVTITGPWPVEMGREAYWELMVTIFYHQH